MRRQRGTFHQSWWFGGAKTWCAAILRSVCRLLGMEGVRGEKRTGEKIIRITYVSPACPFIRFSRGPPPRNPSPGSGSPFLDPHHACGGVCTRARKKQPADVVSGGCLGIIPPVRPWGRGGRRVHSQNVLLWWSAASICSGVCSSSLARLLPIQRAMAPMARPVITRAKAVAPQKP